MKLQKLFILICSHLIAIAAGFAIGLYSLPILIAPPAPDEADIQQIVSQSVYSTRFIPDLKGSDALHWGEGDVSMTHDTIAFMGRLAPGPDYKLYLSPEFVETEAGFERLKPAMMLVGDVKTFNNFVVKLEPEIDLAAYNTIVIWCETFGEFITAGKYR